MSTRSKRSAAATGSIQEQGTPVKVTKLSSVTAESKGKQKTAEPPPSVRSLLSSLAYGPAPESPAVAKAWLEDHGNSLGHFINGGWVKPEGRKTYDTHNPATGERLASTLQGVQEDADLVVAAARKAFESRSTLPRHVRARHMYSIARHVQKHARLISVVESMDNGKSIIESHDLDIPLVARHFYHHAGWAQLMEEEMKGWAPVGVVCAIVPWNFPLMLLTWKVCPALAMGNTVVLKPATYTRLSALLFAEICAEAGLPPGVLNVVTGPGSFGQMIATHPGVDKIGFTGSTQVGQKLRRAIAGSGKKISLELGGKSPFVLFDSADLDSSVEGVVDAIFFNQGQVCSAGSRLIVQENVADRVVAKTKERMTHLRLGDSLDKSVDMGAIVDPTQRKSIDDYVQLHVAREDGAEVYQACAVMPSHGTATAMMWTLHVEGRLFHSGLPHKGINSLELAMEAMAHIQTNFYKDFPPHSEEERYRFATPSTMKPTQIKCSEGSVNQPPWTEMQGDIRLTPFYDAEACLEKVKGYVDALNNDLTQLPTRGPCSKYELDIAEGKFKGKLTFTLEGGILRGIACNLDSLGFQRLDEATRDILGGSEPYSICGSLPLVGDLQRAGFDVQVCGYGHSSVYHGDNEYCSLSCMENALKILSVLLDKFN